MYEFVELVAHVGTAIGVIWGLTAINDAIRHGNRLRARRLQILEEQEARAKQAHLDSV